MFFHNPKTGGTSILKMIGRSHRLGDSHHHVNILPSHLTISDYLSQTDDFGRKIFDEFFTFSFVRNPWELLVSKWSYDSKYGENDNEFKVWLDGVLTHHRNTGYLHKQSEWTHHDGVQAVDFVGRFERIESDISFICDKSSMDASSIIHENSTEHNCYRSYYDSKRVDIVYELYGDDIELFGYSFEGVVDG